MNKVRVCKWSCVDTAGRAQVWYSSYKYFNFTECIPAYMRIQVTDAVMCTVEMELSDFEKIAYNELEYCKQYDHKCYANMIKRIG